MIKEALEYLEMGFNLIPMKPNKFPAIKWGEYQENRQDENFIREWFTSGNYNIAIITGEISGVVVLDIDPKHGADVNYYLSKYPSGLVASTPSGGCHIYFKHPNYKVQNRVGIFPGVDLRADGGYVNAPPSKYQVGNYTWLKQGEPSDFPAELAVENTNVERERINGEDWVSTLLQNGAKSGERNKSLSSLCGYFAEKNVPVDITLQIIQNWNSRNEERLSFREIEDSVKSTYKTILRKNGNKLQTTKPSSVDAPKGSNFALLPLEDFMIQYGDQPIEWIIKDWLPNNTVAFVVSPPGSFKTWTLIDLAVSVASGKPFLGMYKIQPEQIGPVFLVQQEDFSGQTAQRITLVRRSKYKSEALPITNEDEEIEFSVPERIPLYIHPDRKLRFEDSKAMEELEEAIKALKPKLIILDPLYSLGGTEDYMAKLVDDLFIFKRFRDEYGVSFVVAHHTNKGGGQDRTRAWGSQFLNAFLETGWQIEPKGDTSIKIKRHFKASQNMEEICLSFKIDDRETWTYEVQEGLVDSTDKEGKQEGESATVKRSPGPRKKSAEQLLDDASKIVTSSKQKDVDKPIAPKSELEDFCMKKFSPNPIIDEKLKKIVTEAYKSTKELPEFTTGPEFFVEGGSVVKDWKVTISKPLPAATNFLNLHDYFRVIYRAGDSGVSINNLCQLLGKNQPMIFTKVKELLEAGVITRRTVKLHTKEIFVYTALRDIAKWNFKL